MRLRMRTTYFQPGSEWSRIHAIYSSSSATCPGSSQFLSQPENRLEPAPPTSSKVVASSPETSGLITHDAIAIQIRGHPANVFTLTSHGMDFVGDIGERMETLELAEHTWFVGAQFHIEYLNRVLEPRWSYLWFLTASSVLRGGCGELEGLRQVSSDRDSCLLSGSPSPELRVQDRNETSFHLPQKDL